MKIEFSPGITEQIGTLRVSYGELMISQNYCCGCDGNCPDAKKDGLDLIRAGFKMIRLHGDSDVDTLHNLFLMFLNDSERKEFLDRASAIKKTQTEKTTVVCLCGSTRFWREFQRVSLELTLAGRIVLSIGAASGTDDEHFGNLPQEEYDRVKKQLDELHMRKIDLADEVVILNVGGYIGASTYNELAYARKTKKIIRFLEPHRGVIMEAPLKSISIKTL